MFYTLFNKGNQKRLTHPTIGLWTTNKLEEAQDMLVSCKEYLIAQGLQRAVDDFVIIEAESGNEVI
jgi:hypothetical protein